MTHGSGDYVVAFSTAPRLHATAASALRNREVLPDDGLSPLFQAAREATEEAIINSLLRATTVTGHQGHTVEAISIDRVIEICRRHGAIQP